METRLVEYKRIAIRVPKGKSTSEFIDGIDTGDITYSWFIDAVEQAIECSEKGNLSQLEIELARVRTLGNFYKLRGLDEFIHYCAGQAVGRCVKRNINANLLREFGDKYRLFILNPKD